MPSYGERMTAPRGGNGVWARVEGGKGEWAADKANSPATGESLAYDYDLFGARAGFDFAGAGALAGGLSFHHLQGKAELKDAGEISLNGAGFGASFTWTAGDFYADLSAQATWLDAEIDSTVSGKLEKEVGGLAGALGLEVGGRTPLTEGLFLASRLGLTWATASLDKFTDETDGAEVSVEDANSVKGRAGLTIGAEGSGGSLFATVDVAQELSDETSVKITDVTLKTDVKATSVRAGLGGALSLSEGVTLRASGYYVWAGDDNAEYGGGANLSVRF